jgi:hypothetical protein
MRYLKFLPILLLTFLTVFTSCEKDAIEEPDSLEQFDILGKWMLQSRTICGITDMIVLFDTLEFTTGSKSDDLLGAFISISPGDETNGQFEIDPENGTIRFDYNSTQKTYEFQISGNAMTFTYFEDDCEFITDWRKEE